MYVTLRWSTGTAQPKSDNLYTLELALQVHSHSLEYTELSSLLLHDPSCKWMGLGPPHRDVIVYVTDGDEER